MSLRWFDNFNRMVVGSLGPDYVTDYANNSGHIIRTRGYVLSGDGAGFSGFPEADGGGTTQIDFWINPNFNITTSVEITGGSTFSGGLYWTQYLHAYTDYDYNLSQMSLWFWTWDFYNTSQYPVSLNQWYTIKHAYTPGGSEKVKIWPRGTTEPNAWLWQDSPVGDGYGGITPSIVFNTDGRWDNLWVWGASEIVETSPPTPPLAALTETTKVPISVEIRYDGMDITPLCVIAEASFTGLANGNPGDCVIAIKDVTQTQSFTSGKTLELYLNGIREWDGYLMSVSRVYWFDGHTANCSPCDHLTPRKLILRGADRNILFTRRVLFNIASPAEPTDNLWPAGTPDNEIIAYSITNYLSPTDGINYSTKVEMVASPDPFAEIRVPGPTAYFGEMMREISQATGAVFYIDPDRYLVYTDVNTVNGPFELSDRPGVGQVGYRDMLFLARADEMVNDAMVWGAGQGTNNIVFSRVQNQASMDLHNRWQNNNGFHTNLWKQESVDRVANSIVYGSPSSKRGRKDDAISFDCTIFSPSVRIADKVQVESEVYGYSDVLPVRRMTISFPAGPNSVKYDLHLSHELDEPWITNEWWWPAPIENRCPTIGCTVSQPGAPLLGTIIPAGTVDTYLYSGSKRVQKGEIFWNVDIVAGLNIWKWNNRHEVETCEDRYGGYVECQYQWAYTDWLRYGGSISGPWYADLVFLGGPQIDTWFTDYKMHRAASNNIWPGETVTGHVLGTLSFTDNEYDRLHTGQDGGGTGGPYVGPTHHILISQVFPKKKGDCWALREIGRVFVEADMNHGDSIPIDTYLNFASGEHFGISVQIWEIRNNRPVVLDARASFSYDITYHPNFPSGFAYIPGCVEIPVCGPACVTGTRVNPVGEQSISTTGSTLGNTIYVDYAPVYQVPVSYIPGSTKVTIDGLLQRLGIDYTESSPILGEITLAGYLLDSIRGSTLGGEPTVYICFDGAGYFSGPNLPLPGAQFIIPTGGYITGTFGAQTSLWPSTIWHNVYYPHFHNGVDFGVGIGTPVYAAADGVLVWEDQAAGGNMLTIYHAEGMRTVYAHLSNRLVADGLTVSQGDLIALSGDSGEVTGAHLHWGLVFAGSPEDPIPYTTYQSATPSSVPLITGG